MLREKHVSTWEPMSAGVDDLIWDRFLTRFSGLTADQRRAAGRYAVIQDPMPSQAWSVSWAYGPAIENIEKDLNIKALRALQKSTGPDEVLYALQLLSQGYYFRPHVSFDYKDRDAWMIGILPDGEHFLFTNEELNIGIFSSLGDQTICVFGQTLLDAFEEEQPALFTKKVRENGVPARCQNAAKARFRN